MSSSLQEEYNFWYSKQWCHPDPNECPCHGSGWAISDVDTEHTCRYHYKGQPSLNDEDPEAWDNWRNAQLLKELEKEWDQYYPRYSSEEEYDLFIALEEALDLVMRLDYLGSRGQVKTTLASFFQASEDQWEYYFVD